jgi:hypothetical protein
MLPDQENKNYLKFTDFKINEDYFTYEEKFQNFKNNVLKSHLVNATLCDVRSFDLYMSGSRNFSIGSQSHFDSGLGGYDITQPAIGPLSTIEYLVESTYFSNEHMKDYMIMQTCELEKYTIRWRPINGDGNCFYRSVMFSFLEQAIFDKDVGMFIMLIVEINEIFLTTSWPGATYIKDYNKLSSSAEKTMTALYIIYNLLDSSTGDTNISQAYKFLINFFNHFKAFDTIIVYYLRAKLYEFIEENKDKYYSEEFNIKLGNLLPAQFETESGEFLFNIFYQEDLLKDQSYAEKISIYLIPFILRNSIQIVNYNFGNDMDITTRTFEYLNHDSLSHNQFKLIHPITVIYRRTHYDIGYDNDFFLNNSKYLCEFTNLHEDLKVINEKLIKNFKMGLINMGTSPAGEINKNNSSINIEKRLSSIKSSDNKNQYEDINQLNNSKSATKCLLCNKISLQQTDDLFCKDCVISKYLSILIPRIKTLLKQNKFFYEINKIEQIMTNFNKCIYYSI